MILGFLGYKAYQKILNKPRKQTEYAGLRLGMEMQEVEYIKGDPDTVLTPEGESDFEWWTITNVKDLKKGEHLQDFPQWSYPIGEQRIDVTFDPLKRSVYQIECYSKGYGLCPSIFDLSNGSSETEVIGRLGQPTSTRFMGTVKRLEYDDLGAWFFLEKQSVYMIAVRDPSVLNEDLKRAPPCKDGKSSCNPWERDWGATKLQRGTVVTNDGRVATPSKP
jgi:hypothetical protein